MHMQPHSGITIFAKRWILNVWQCSEYASVSITAPFCYVLHQAHSEFCHIQNSIYSSTFSHIQAYSVLLRHIQAYWGIAKAYSGLFMHIQNLLSPSHMQKPDIFGILEYTEPFHNFILTHIQNPVIFTKTGRPCVTLEIRNPGTMIILEYSEPWHI